MTFYYISSSLNLLSFFLSLSFSLLYRGETGFSDYFFVFVKQRMANDISGDTLLEAFQSASNTAQIISHVASNVPAVCSVSVTVRGN